MGQDLIVSHAFLMWMSPSTSEMSCGYVSRICVTVLSARTMRRSWRTRNLHKIVQGIPPLRKPCIANFPMHASAGVVDLGPSSILRVAISLHTTDSESVILLSTMLAPVADGSAVKSGTGLSGMALCQRKH